MKHTLKFVSLLLTLVMVCTMIPTVLAAGEGSITVENPVAGQTYTAYKIFDVVYDTPGDDGHYSYTIAADSLWLTTVQDYAGVTLSDLVTDADGDSFYVVTINDSFNAPNFSAVLKAAAEGKDGTELETGADGLPAAVGLDLGYYFVMSSTGALTNLTTTAPNAVIRDKNDIRFEKTDDDESVELGQVVNYTIADIVPDTTGFASYTYKITDTMSDGLTFQEDVTVTIGGVDVTEACTLTYTDNGFALTIPVVDYQAQVGETILVTYSAIVNENAVGSVENNQAQLEYTNDPSGSTTTTPEKETTVYTAEIIIDKFEAGAEDTKLTGAQFVLLNNGTVNPDGTIDESNVGKYYQLTDGVVSWVEDQADATVVTTDENGAASFAGLADGDYQLLEIQAPAGYNMLDKPVDITIDGSDAEAPVLTYEEGIANSTGSTLPETGGIGTTIFYILGGGMFLAAVVLLVTKKRMYGEA